MPSGYHAANANILKNKLIASWIKDEKFSFPLEAQCAFSFLSSGFWGIVQEWLENPEMESLTPEEMKDIIVMLLHNNIYL